MGKMAKNTIVWTMAAVAGGMLLAAPAHAISVKPGEVLVLEDTPLYDGEEMVRSSGVVSGVQAVRVVDVDTAWNEDKEQEPSAFEVETWLGPKWIRSDDRVVVGTYREAARTVTLATYAAMYDKPNRAFPSGGTLAPQKLNALATLYTMPSRFIDATSLQGRDSFWYEVDTWLGPKWLLGPNLMEDVTAIEVSYRMKLSGEEILYSAPFTAAAIPDRKLSPQVVQVVAEWNPHSGPWDRNWYLVELPVGKRWIAPEHEVLTSYEERQDKVTLPTETRYFARPQLDIDSTKQLPAGTYDAFEASGDWVHLHTSVGDVWVNPKRALQERPVGIVPTNEKVELTKETATFQYPLTGEPMHMKGFYAPQTVQAYEKWTSPEGAIWYAFRNWYGKEEWVNAVNAAPGDK